MTIQEEFDLYIQAVYGNDGPKELSPETGEQYTQLRKAFFGGCLVAYTNQANLVPELMRYYEAIKMNATFLGTKP